MLSIEIGFTPVFGSRKKLTLAIPVRTIPDADLNFGSIMVLMSGCAGGYVREGGSDDDDRGWPGSGRRMLPSLERGRRESLQDLGRY